MIVFWQEHRNARHHVKLYKARHDGVVGPTDDNRYTIQLFGIEHVGSTERKWQEFVGPGQNPVRYVVHPSV